MTLSLEHKVKLLKTLYTLITPEKQIKFDEIASDRTNHITVAVENIYQDHNASAVMRTCDCFGVRDLHIIEKTNKFTVQRDIAMGATRWVNHFHYSDLTSPTTKCISSLKEKGYKVIATSPHAENKDIFNINLDQPMAFIFGTEKSGLSDIALEMADEHVNIPMYGFTESFNISVSAALTLQAIRNRLAKQDHIDWRLNVEQQIDLKIHWCKQILKNPDNIVNEIIKRINSGIY